MTAGETTEAGARLAKEGQVGESGTNPFIDLARCLRVVVKVGTSTLTRSEGGVDQERIRALVEEIALLRAGGREVLLVTSGAIGVGAARLGLTTRPRTIPGMQAAAAVGQTLLMELYEERFRALGYTVAQVLLTRGDLTNRHRYLNARATLLTLLRYGVIPIINENDTVAVDEIRIGDNDTLAAMVVGLVGADLLVILTDIDGVYSADPRQDQTAKRLRVVEGITPALVAAAGGEGSRFATGGMQTKIEAARIATAAGAAMVIADGAQAGVLSALLAGQEAGTLFLPRKRRLPRRKQWLAFSFPVRGTLTVDSGAAQALAERGKSLLPSGVTAVAGDFQAGDLVRVVDEEGWEFARGLVNYSAAEMERIRGCALEEIAARLGRPGRRVVIHRDDMVLL